MADKKETTPAPGPQDNTIPMLVSRIEQIIKLEDERKDLAEEIKEFKSELKAQGFDTKIINKVIKRMQRDPDEVTEEDTMIATYEDAIRRHADSQQSG